MIFYLLLFAFLLLLPKNKKSGALLFFLIVGLVCALRYNVGYDFSNYLDIILGRNQYSITYDRLEPTTKWLIGLARWLEFSQIYFIVTSALIVGGIAYYVYKESADYRLSILIFMSIPLFFWASLSIIRQFMAVAFGLLYFHYLFQGRWRVAFSWFLLAVLSHGSAWILLFAMIIRKYPISMKGTYVIYALSFTSSIVLPILTTIKIDLEIVTRAQRFIVDNEGLMGYKSQFIMFNLIFVLVLFLLRQIKKHSLELQFQSNLFLIGVSIFNIFSPVAVVGGRLSTFFLIVLIVLLPNLLFLIPRRTVTRYCALCSCLFLYVYTLRLATSSYEQGLTQKDPYTPYQTFLMREKLYNEHW